MAEASGTDGADGHRKDQAAQGPLLPLLDTKDWRALATLFTDDRQHVLLLEEPELPQNNADYLRNLERNSSGRG